MPETSYPAPLNRLLTFGDAGAGQPWPDYLALGLGPEHIPDLIRMAADPALNDADSGSPAVWAPGHAWRALAQMHAAEAAPALAQLFQRVDDNDDDFVNEDLPEAFGLLGAGALPALMDYLADDSHGLYARIAAAHSLSEIGLRNPAAREACVAVLSGQLGLFAQQDSTLSGFLVAFLLELKAVEAADVIELAFKADAVDEAVAGNLDDVQRELGVTAERDRVLRVPGAPAAVYELADAANKPRPQTPPTPQSVVEARLAQALREAELEIDTAPKRKHHRKRK